MDTPVCRLDEIVDGITLSENNRATVYERGWEGVAQLHQYMQNNYIQKGVRAVLVGIRGNSRDIKYAVFVQDDFLCYTNPED